MTSKIPCRGDDATIVLQHITCDMLAMMRNIRNPTRSQLWDDYDHRTLHALASRKIVKRVGDKVMLTVFGTKLTEALT